MKQSSSCFPFQVQSISRRQLFPRREFWVLFWRWKNRVLASPFKSRVSAAGSSSLGVNFGFCFGGEKIEFLLPLSSPEYQPQIDTPYPCISSSILEVKKSSSCFPFQVQSISRRQLFSRREFWVLFWGYKNRVLASPFKSRVSAAGSSSLGVNFGFCFGGGKIEFLLPLSSPEYQPPAALL